MELFLLDALPRVCMTLHLEYWMGGRVLLIP